jgi:hypothetical protein
MEHGTSCGAKIELMVSMGTYDSRLLGGSGPLRGFTLIQDKSPKRPFT